MVNVEKVGYNRQRNRATRRVGETATAQFPARRRPLEPRGCKQLIEETFASAKARLKEAVHQRAPVLGRRMGSAR